MAYKYLEVRERTTDKVVNRIDVSNESERSIDRIERGMNINMNHADYYTEVNESNTKLEKVLMNGV